LNDPHRSALQALIRAYTQNEVDDLSRFVTESEEGRVIRRSLEMQGQMTDLVSRALAAGTPIAVSLTNTLNEVSSANAARLAAYEEVLPWSIQLLLLLAAIVPSFLTGRMQGASQKTRQSGAFSFILLISLATYITLDLNQGRRGLIRVSTRPFERLTHNPCNLALALRASAGRRRGDSLSRLQVLSQLRSIIM
jgi:hypothetical protein